MSSVFVKKCKKGGKLTTFLTTLFLDRFVPLNPPPYGHPFRRGRREATTSQLNHEFLQRGEQNLFQFFFVLGRGLRE